MCNGKTNTFYFDSKPLSSTLETYYSEKYEGWTASDQKDLPSD